MAKINYSIRSSKKRQPVSIYVRLRDGKVDLVAPIGKSIYPENWSQTTQLTKQRITNDNLIDPFTTEMKADLDDYLTKFKVYLLNEFNNSTELVKHSNLPNGKLSKEETKANTDWIKNVVEKFRLQEAGESPGEITVCNYIQSYIDLAKAHIIKTRNSKNKAPYSDGTIGGFISLKSQLEHFQDEKHGGKALKFSDIGMDFYDEFTLFFQDKKYRPNSIGKFIRILKVIMRVALEDKNEVSSNTIMNQKKFFAPSSDSPAISLTANELQKIYDLKLTGELEMVRDIFYLGTCIAQRISDWRITPDNIVRLKIGRAVELYHKKTKTRVKVPISDQLEVILKKYNDTMPTAKELPNAKINEGLKIIGQMAKITQKVLIKEQIGHMAEVIRTPEKWELITSHTARRTGATLMQEAGFTTAQCMQVTGHKTERQFQTYVKTDVDKTAEILSDNPYFRNGMKVVG